MALRQSPAEAVVPVADLDRAARFYRDFLGLAVENDAVHDTMAVHAGSDTLFELKLAPGMSHADSEVLTFHVEDIESEVSALRRTGVRFEQRDEHEGQSLVAEVEGVRLAWFRDSESNLLALRQG